MSENRSLCVLEVLVHLTDVLPDKYMLGAADLHSDLSVEIVSEAELPPNWATLSVPEQTATRTLGDDWRHENRSVALSVPSVISGERNFLLNPEHPDFARIKLLDAIPFHFDLRLFKAQTLEFARKV